MLAAKIAASTGVSSARNGRKAGLGSSCPIVSKYCEQFQSKHNCCRDDDPLENDVIAPMLLKRRVGTAHRAISHVVPSLESLMTTPIAASSSRMRSDSLKSFRAGAAVGSEIRPSLCVASIPLACCFRLFHSAALLD